MLWASPLRAILLEALGNRPANAVGNGSYGVVGNPPKKRSMSLTADDKVTFISEN